MEDGKEKQISVLLTSSSTIGPYFKLAGSDLLRKHRSCRHICWSGKNPVRGALNNMVLCFELQSYAAMTLTEV
jgi:hypothetical protein